MKRRALMPSVPTIGKTAFYGGKSLANRWMDVVCATE